MATAAVELCGHLPLAWCNAPGDDQVYTATMDDNLVLLKALLLLDEDASVAGDEERGPLFALHTKTDLLLLMMSRGLRGLESLPAPVRCCIDAQRLRWQGRPAGVAPTATTSGALALYLRPRIAIPLILPGNIVAGPDAADDPWCGYFAYRLSATVQECLDRLIFRHHRRSIARSRENP